MAQVFYSFTLTAQDLLEKALAARNISLESVRRTKNGKPYLSGGEFHFNLSHSGNLSVCAVSQNPIGVDCEKVAPIRKRVFRQTYDVLERSFVKSDADFAKIWAQKESVIKYHGGTLADLKHSHIVFPSNALFHDTLCRAKLFCEVLCCGADKYALCIATEDDDYTLQQQD